MNEEIIFKLESWTESLQQNGLLEGHLKYQLMELNQVRDEIYHPKSLWDLNLKLDELQQILLCIWFDRLTFSTIQRTFLSVLEHFYPSEKNEMQS